MGYIYSYSYNNELLYIGSTFNLHERELGHKKTLRYENQLFFHRCLNEKNLKIEDLIKDTIYTGIKNKKELKRYEGMLIKELNPKYNKAVPGRTKKEYREDNLDHILKINMEYRNNNKEKNKEYREDNKDKLLEQKKEYYVKNKDKIKEKDKLYREKNIDKIKEYQKNYIELNKDKLKKQKKEFYKIYYEKNKDKIKEKRKIYYEKNKEGLVFY